MLPVSCRFNSCFMSSWGNFDCLRWNSVMGRSGYHRLVPLKEIRSLPRTLRFGFPEPTMLRIAPGISIGNASSGTSPPRPPVPGSANWRPRIASLAQRERYRSREIADRYSETGMGKEGAIGVPRTS